ncbi:MAG TPA: cytidine deaminase [Acholeplasmataceae bacterium]|jgi:cytidine deaminase|nr:cytidine deaminase [Acholeplasmataceae bacterium]
MNTNEKLYEKVIIAYQNAYTPYSKFNVGAALLMKDGSIITGSNIENASYGLSNCAERSALFAAYSQGYRKEDIVKMMVIGATDRPISPCGACRQVMSELIDAEVEVVLTNLNKDFKSLKVKDLLPYSFSDGDLHGKGF